MKPQMGPKGTPISGPPFFPYPLIPLPDIMTNCDYSSWQGFWYEFFMLFDSFMTDTPTEGWTDRQIKGKFLSSLSAKPKHKLRLIFLRNFTLYVCFPVLTWIWILKYHNYNYIFDWIFLQIHHTCTIIFDFTFGQA